VLARVKTPRATLAADAVLTRAPRARLELLSERPEDVCSNSAIASGLDSGSPHRRVPFGGLRPPLTALPLRRTGHSSAPTLSTRAQTVSF
jgi:hypothetical protein